MEVNDYPVLHQRKKEFTLLNKLYGLYLAVNRSIDGYFDILWSDVDTEVIFAELLEFQNRYIEKTFPYVYVSKLTICIILDAENFRKV